jgi:hypothetical protein
MKAEGTHKSALKSARCPQCAQPMRLARRTLRFGGLPDLVTFDCQTCDESHTEEIGPPRETSPKIDVGSWYLDEAGNPTREIKRRD